MIKLYDFQKDCVEQLLGGKHIICSSTGSGKSYIAFEYLRRKNPDKILVVGLPSKIASRDFESDAVALCGAEWVSNRTIEYVSWYKLHEWVYKKHFADLSDWTVAFDECMPYEMPVITDKGKRKLGDLQVGDKVLSYNHTKGKTEYKEITRTIRKPAPNKMIRLHLSNGTAIISTSNHPHYTKDGYQKAEDIKVGDTLYEMHCLREGDRPVRTYSEEKTQLSEDRESLLFGGMWPDNGKKGNNRGGAGQKKGYSANSDKVPNVQKRTFSGRNEHLPEGIFQKNGKSILLDDMCEQVERREGKRAGNKRTREKVGEDSPMLSMSRSNPSKRLDKRPENKTFSQRANLLLGKMLEICHIKSEQKEMAGQGISCKNVTNIIREHEEKQPYVEKGNKRKGFRNEESKRMAANMEDIPGTKRWKWKIYRAPESVVGKSKQKDEGLGDGTTSKLRQERARVSNLLQTRCWERILQDRDRVRRRKPSFRKSASKGQEEDRQISPVRVESVEVLKLGDIKRRGLYREPDYVYCIDVEDNHNFFANGILTHNCHFAAAGVSSKRGQAFLTLAQRCKNWTGYTATPGDTWIKFYPYFTAAGMVKNKTAFMREFCIQQTYPFPMIKGYVHEDRLSEMWQAISYAPDTSDVFAQLPKKTYQLIRLPKPTGYDKCIKKSQTLEGEFLDSNMALAHYAREMCATKKKQEWLAEWLDGTDEGAVVFYNYTKERDDILEVCKKKKRKVWRIDGQKHEIPTPDTYHRGDLVVAHYQSGGASLNLQFLRYWVSYSYNYSYTTFLQALGRIDRIGQERPMTFYFLRCEGTIEDDIAKALSKKRDFAEREWDGG